MTNPLARAVPREKGDHSRAYAITLPKDDFGKFAIIEDDILSADECDALVNLAEREGFGAALLNVGGGQQVMATDVRRSSRCIIDSFDLASSLLERVRHLLPETMHAASVRARLQVGPSTDGEIEYRLAGLNERLRFLKYDPGDYFAPHMDGAYATRDGSGKRSALTIQFYLREPSEGGETTFWDGLGGAECLRAAPAVASKPGRTLIFQHDVYHEGSVVKSGRKYVIRTDVMYSPVSV